jgi:hypothetical protein
MAGSSRYGRTEIGLTYILLVWKAMRSESTDE